MSRKKHRLYIAYLLFTLSFLLVDIPARISAHTSGRVYIYGFPESVFSEISLDYFKGKSDWEIAFYSLNDTFSSERFLKIVETLQVSGVEIVPTWECISCLLSHLSWDEILMMYSSPLMGIFSEGRLTAITVRIADYDVFDQAVTAEGKDVVRVFAASEVYSLTDEGIKVRLEELFLEEERSEDVEIDVLKLTYSVVLLALADSVNPCTFAVFTALLLIALHSLGRMKTATTGFSFILAIFSGYFVLGLGLLQFLAAIPYIDKILAAVGLAIGILSITRGLKPEFRSPIPKSLRSFMELRTSKSYFSPAASFLLGITATFTLLPCSSGPYVVGLGLLSTFGNSAQAYLLTVYNILFVMPLVGILVAVLSSRGLARKIKFLRSTRLGIMELISGTLLVAVCMCLLLT